jgi:hypothetical protein
MAVSAAKLTPRPFENLFPLFADAHRKDPGPRTVQSFADRLGVPVKYVRDIMGGKPGSYKQAMEAKIAEAMQVEFRELWASDSTEGYACLGNEVLAAIRALPGGPALDFKPVPRYLGQLLEEIYAAHYGAPRAHGGYERFAEHLEFDDVPLLREFFLNRGTQAAAEESSLLASLNAKLPDIMGGKGGEGFPTLSDEIAAAIGLLPEGHKPKPGPDTAGKAAAPKEREPRSVHELVYLIAYIRIIDPDMAVPIGVKVYGKTATATLDIPPPFVPFSRSEANALAKCIGTDKALMAALLTRTEYSYDDLAGSNLAVRMKARFARNWGIPSSRDFKNLGAELEAAIEALKPRVDPVAARRAKETAEAADEQRRRAAAWERRIGSWDTGDEGNEGDDTPAAHRKNGKMKPDAWRAAVGNFIGERRRSMTLDGFQDAVARVKKTKSKAFAKVDVGAAIAGDRKVPLEFYAGMLNVLGKGLSPTNVPQRLIHARLVKAAPFLFG